MPTQNRKSNQYAGRDVSDYVMVHNVPLFDEHVGRDGCRYTREVLNGMAKTMNERIDDSGDYTPIAEHHTPEPEERARGMPEPETIGYSGPYYVALFGKVKPRWCIYAKNWGILRTKLHKYKPRRSVEVWPDSNPHKRVFDPIAVLGSQTPKRDLGLVHAYGRSRQRDRYALDYDLPAPEKYEAMALSTPGGANTFIPTTGSPKKRKPEKLAQETPGMDGPLSHDQLQQIVQAIVPVVEAKIASMQAPEPEPDDAMEGAPDASAGMDAGGAPGDMGDPMGEGDAAPDMSADENGEGAPADGDGDADDQGEPADHYAALCQMADGGDMDGAQQYMQGLSDEDKQAATEQYAAEADPDKKAKLKPIFEAAPAAPVAGGEPTAPIRNAREGEADKYRQEAERYRAERDGYRNEAAKYARELQAVNGKLSAAEVELVELRFEKVKAERYSRIQDKIDAGYQFDVQDARDDAAAATPEEFERQMKWIDKNSARVPFGSLPREPLEPEPSIQRGPRLPAEAQAEKYNRRALELARADNYATGKSYAAYYEMAVNEGKQQKQTAGAR